MLQKSKSKKIFRLKYLVLLPLVMGILFYTSCKIDSSSETSSNKKLSLEERLVPFAVVDEVPVFPGCEDATDKRACFQQKMQEHISKNFHYPEGAQKLGYQGRVNVLFTINSSGKIENIKKRGPHKLLEEEVHRIISSLPQMQPGKQKGEVVDVPYSIPVSFVLD